MKSLSNLKKIASFLMFIESDNPGATKPIFEELGEGVSKKILKEMEGLEKIDRKSLDKVVNEFYELAVQKENVFGGKHLSEGIMKSLYENQTGENLAFEKSDLSSFSYIYHQDENKVIEYLNHSSNQLSALILSNLDSDKAARLMQGIRSENVSDIAQKILTLNVPNTELIWKLQFFIEKKLMNMDISVLKKENKNADKLSRIIELISSDKRGQIMESLAQDDNDAGVSIDFTGNVLEFKDLESLPEKDMEVFLFDMSDTRTLAIAMTGCSASFETKILNLFSERMKNIYKEEQSSVVGIEKEGIASAQSKIIYEIRNLEKQGKIGTIGALEKVVSGSSENDDDEF
ncbi:hypothetical protein HOG98_05250 [bacterium]|nr:hypothetical protein [bacterium]